MFRYKTVIFDLDGTLLDTLEDLTDSVNYALCKYGFKERTLEEIRGFVGNGIGKLIERAVPDGLSNSNFNAVFDTFTQHYKLNCQTKTRPYDGIELLLDVLKKEGIKLGIVSNKADFAVKDLNKYYFGKYEMQALGEKDGIDRKPSPDMVYAVLEDLKADLNTAVYVGDSEVDINTARNAGLPCISVLWGFRDREFLEARDGIEFVSTPEELLEHLTVV